MSVSDPNSVCGPALPEALDSGALLISGQIPPRSYVVKPYVPSGELTELVGAHGHLKSTIALDLCASVATGRKWGGGPTVKGRAAFITLEDSLGTLQERALAWLSGIQGAAESEAARVDLRANLLFLAREKAQGLVITATTPEGVTTADLGVADHIARLTRGCSVVVLETASRIHAGPETNEGFAPLIRAVERITSTGPALVIVRHVSKLTASKINNGEELTSYAGRGGSALSDAARSVLVVVRQAGSPGYVTLTAAKTTHAAPGEKLTWTPVVVSVGPGNEAVRLDPLTPESQQAADAARLLAWLALRPEGVFRSWFNRAGNTADGLSRDRAKQALEYLAATGGVLMRKEVRGANEVEVFYAPGRAQGIAA